jgi:hypothetical protein
MIFNLFFSLTLTLSPQAGRGDKGDGFFQKVGIIKNSFNPLSNISFWNKKIDLTPSLDFLFITRKYLIESPLPACGERVRVRGFSL